MREARGLYYIARLLAEPGSDVWASHLLAAAVGIDPRITAGVAEPLLDSVAMAEYRKQYRELEEDLEEARAMNDLGRIESVVVKQEFFATEISRATGLFGKRREQSTIENVRKSVSTAVARAIESIRAEHAALGNHLDGFISSGRIFRYVPDRECHWLT